MKIELSDERLLREVREELNRRRVNIVNEEIQKSLTCIRARLYKEAAALVIDFATERDAHQQQQLKVIIDNSPVEGPIPSACCRTKNPSTGRNKKRKK